MRSRQAGGPKTEVLIHRREGMTAIGTVLNHRISHMGGFSPEYRSPCKEILKSRLEAPPTWYSATNRTKGIIVYHPGSEDNRFGRFSPVNGFYLVVRCLQTVLLNQARSGPQYSNPTQRDKRNCNVAASRLFSVTTH